jgi:hypothetical protein
LREVHDDHESCLDPYASASRAVTAIRWTFASGRAWVVAVFGLVAYAVIYLLVAKAIVIDASAQFSRFGDLPRVIASPDLSLRSLMSWLDPAFVLYVSDALVIAPSVPALVTALLLGSLIGVNAAMAVESVVRRPAACEGDRPWWLAAVLPSFLASFSCCAPTVLLLLGGSFAGALIGVIPFVVPVAAVVLFASLVWSARRLERTTVLAA